MMHDLARQAGDRGNHHPEMLRAWNNYWKDLRGVENDRPVD